MKQVFYIRDGLNILKMAYHLKNGEFIEFEKSTHVDTAVREMLTDDVWKFILETNPKQCKELDKQYNTKIKNKFFKIY